MKPIRILLSALTALMVVISLAGAQAAPLSSTTGGTVSVTEGGTFNVYVCPFNTTRFRFSYWQNPRDPQVTSSQGEDTHGTLTICYLDSKAYRGAFFVNLSATDFYSISPGITATIDVDNLSMYRSYSIGRWNFLTGVHQPGAYEGTMYSVSPLGEYPARAWNAPDPSLGWNPGATLDTQRTIARAETGSGLSQQLENPSGQHIYTARQAVVMSLHVPAGTPAATYRTTLTITVIPDGI